MATAQRSKKKTANKEDGKKRKKPGATGQGDYYHIEIRPSKEFTTFRTHDVGEKGGLQRVAGQRADGSWETQKWLVSKDLAHTAEGRLVADADDAQELLDELGSVPEQVEGDRFQAQPETAE